MIIHVAVVDDDDYFDYYLDDDHYIDYDLYSMNGLHEFRRTAICSYHLINKYKILLRRRLLPTAAVLTIGIAPVNKVGIIDAIIMPNGMAPIKIPAANPDPSHVPDFSGKLI
ncbi:hypothetical protein DERP_012531 [Dermatophagoides pteronyssinus]|uniref:Uncharacterized protein n=1 Tax=Dermatophagoides pteronyssinus TaxID=6956 RepID=A0ABQ8IUS0_DERPT|nr:hypothetical protein DERP_012531 [Dermatophagoides pteronyssinus]